MKLIHHIINHMHSLIQDNEYKTTPKNLVILNDVLNNLYKLYSDVHTEIDLNEENTQN
jgi:hypothetical protein